MKAGMSNHLGAAVELGTADDGTPVRAPVVSGRPWWLDDPTFRVWYVGSEDSDFGPPSSGPDERYVVIGYASGNTSNTVYTRSLRDADGGDSVIAIPPGQLCPVGGIGVRLLANRYPFIEDFIGWVATIREPHGSVIPSAACYFTFDEDEDADGPKDRSGNRRHGMTSATTQYGTPAKLGARAFTGGAAFEVPDTGVVPTADVWTVTAWVSSLTDGDGPLNTGIILLGSNSVPLLAVSRAAATGPSGLTAFDNAVNLPGVLAVPGTYYHIALVRSDNEYRIHLNGTVIYRGTADGGWTNIGVGYLSASFLDVNTPTDEVGIWDTALTPAAIAALAAGQRPPNVPQP